ncbi:PAXIP1-associated glutamate-rich protein 1 [Polypterus senegalus]|nr:PAXIP1-associated glutamate-rich protein 1 [Polypterus senegalus]
MQSMEASTSEVQEGLESLAVETEDTKKEDQPEEQSGEKKDEAEREEQEEEENEEEGEKEKGMKAGEESDEQEREADEREDDQQDQTEEADEENDDDWCLPCSDDEISDPVEWMPPVSEIKRLYDMISKGDVPQLEMEILPRRPPTPEPDPDGMSSGSEDSEEERERQEREARNRERAPSPTEFDFDDEPVPSTPKNSFLDRRRTPGSSVRSQRREARLDKVLSDMKRHKKIEEQILRTGHDLFKLDPPEPEKDGSTPKKAPGDIFSPRQRKY